MAVLAAVVTVSSPDILLPTAAAAPAAQPARTPITIRPAVPEDTRLQSWDAGHILLDNGRNQPAITHFEKLLERDPDDLLAAQGFCLALTRRCALDSVLARTGTPGSVLRAYFEGERLRGHWQLAAAAKSFRLSADLAAARGDSLSVAIASLEAARILGRENQIVESRVLATRARRAAAGLIGAFAVDSRTGAGRLSDELALHEADLETLSGRMATADSLYRRLLPRLRDAGRRRLECDAMNGLGVSLTRRRLVRESAECFARSVVLAELMGDRGRLAQALSNLGYDESQRRELDAAEEHLERARGIAEQCGIQYQLGFIEVSLGAVAEARGDRPGAVARFRSGVSAHARVGHRAGEVDARQRLAYSLLMMGEYGEAITQYERCLVLGDSLGTPMARNWVLGGLALAHHKLGRLETAAGYYHQTMALNESLGDRSSVAWCLNSLGLLKRLKGDFRQALVHHNRARAIYEELNDAEGTGNSLVDLSEVYAALGDHERAFSEAGQAFEIARRDSLEELLRASATALAAACASAGRTVTASGHLRSALEIARRWRDSEAVVWALADLAEFELQMGRPDEAQTLLREAETLLEPGVQWALRARVLRLLGRSAGSPADAARLTARALDAAAAGGIPESEWRCLSDLGLYRLALGDTAGSLAFQLRAIDVIESLRGRAGLDELRRHMLRPALEPYERSVDLLLSGTPGRSAIVSALACAERSRAQILSQRIERAMAEASTETSDKENRLSRIAFLQARLQDAGLGPAERESIREEIRNIDAADAARRLENPVLDEPFTPARLDPVTVQSLLAVLGPEERLVYYLLGEKRSWLLSSTAGRLSAHPLQGRASLEPRVLSYLELLRETETAPIPPEILDTARRELYSLFLGPLQSELKPGETLVLVLDGLLHRLPFASLHNGTGYLVASHRIFTAPSLQALASLRHREAVRRAVAAREFDVVAIGHAGRAGTRGAARVLPFTGEPVAALPGAESEAKRVAGLFERAVLLRGKSASEDALKRSPLDRCSILHIAAHGSSHDTEVEHSFILLDVPGSTAGREEGLAPGDGLLQWHEAAALPLSASLVTLASCRSAGGVLTAGEGVTGITQAFLHAGGTCVLAALSDVPDDLSRQLMMDFYRDLRRGRTAAEALQAAQLKAVEDSDAGSCGWAGFVLVGDGSVTLAGPGRPGGAWRLRPGLLAAGIFLAALCVIFLAVRSNRWRP